MTSNYHHFGGHFFCPISRTRSENRPALLRFSVTSRWNSPLVGQSWLGIPSGVIKHGQLENISICVLVLAKIIYKWKMCGVILEQFYLIHLSSIYPFQSSPCHFTWILALVKHLELRKCLPMEFQGLWKQARTYPVGPWVENQPPDWELSSRLWSLGHPWINVSKGKLHRYRLYTRLSRLGTHMPPLLQICSSGRVECPQLSQFQGTIGPFWLGSGLLQARNCSGFVNTNLYIYYIIL